MIKQPNKPEFLDRIKAKCQMIETNLKNFKLKSRQNFQSLVEEEKALLQELSVMEDKFDTWDQEHKGEINKDKVSRRTTSVSNRLYAK